MTVLASVSAENFCQFEKFELPLAHLGLVWIGGINKDSSGAISNGAGKSNATKAIGWCLYGETVENEPADDVIREGEKLAKVSVKTECGWEFIRERKKGSPKLSVLHHGKPLSGSKADLQKKIIEVVGYDWSSFLNAVMYAQRDTKRFLHPRTTDAERKNVIQHIQGTEIVNEAHEWIRKEAGKLRKELEEQEREQANAKTVLATLDVPGLKSKEEHWETSREGRIEALRTRISELTDRARLEMKKSKKRKAERDFLELRKKVLEEELETLKAERVKCRELERDLSLATDRFVVLRSKASVETRSYEERLERLKRLIDAKVCPVCSSPVGSHHAAEHVNNEKSELVAQFEKLTALNESVVKAKTQNDADKKLVADLWRTIDSSTVEDKIAEIKGKLSTKTSATDLALEFIAQAKRTKSEIEKNRQEENPYTGEIEAAEKKKLAADKKLSLAKKKIAELSQELGHYEFWRKGFSPTGLPSYMLDEAMPLLTERANHYLETLADGDITINFSAQRELASSGETRDEIGISWEIEGVEQKLPSGGQWRKLEIATDLAFVDLAAAGDSNALDLLILDEVLDGLDAVGRARLTRLLHMMRSHKGTILVVSHDSDISEIFEKSISIVKEDGIARLEIK